MAGSTSTTTDYPCDKFDSRTLIEAFHRMQELDRMFGLGAEAASVGVGPIPGKPVVTITAGGGSIASISISPDPEVQAIASTVEQLNRLSPNQATRVAMYLYERFACGRLDTTAAQD